jgi:hypothetical protein
MSTLVSDLHSLEFVLLVHRMLTIGSLYLGPPEKVSRSHSRQEALPR